MVFSSTIFIFLFLPVCLAGYFLLKGSIRNYWLLVVSIVFFAWSQPKYLWIILLSIVINYVGAAALDKIVNLRKPILVLTIAANLALLFYYKYFDFTIESLNRFTGLELAVRNIILPVGISFFTFQGLSYVIDVYRKDVPVQRNIFKVGLYLSLIHI